MSDQHASVLEDAGYRSFPPGLHSDWAESAWERRVEGEPEYSRGEGRFSLHVYVAKRYTPGRWTYTVEAYGETGQNANPHRIESYGLEVLAIEGNLAAAEDRVLAAWRAISIAGNGSAPQESPHAAARDPEWRTLVLQASAFVIGPLTDETGERVYPVIDPDDPEYWFASHANKATSERHARRLLAARGERQP